MNGEKYIFFALFIHTLYFVEALEVGNFMEKCLNFKMFNKRFKLKIYSGELKSFLIKRHFNGKYMNIIKLFLST